MAKKIAIDLLKNPDYGEVNDMPSTVGDSPYDKALDMLSVLSGPQLEIMTRTNNRMVEACNVAFNICSNFHSEYIAGRVDQLMRFAVSLQGKGRTEVVDSLKAGAQAVAIQSYERGYGGLSYRELPDD